MTMFKDVPKDSKAVIFSLSGPEVTPEEAALFSAAKPLGFILFDKPGARNIQNPAQLKALTDSLKDCVGWDCPVLIDQEGGARAAHEGPALAGLSTRQDVWRSGCGGIVRGGA
ncbi:MAG: hypothetical protein LRY54_00050 [Alphaproteobacteria bacterium]|nr:hypothetical protein [Alphaproteobacteria bacterium]